MAFYDSIRLEKGMYGAGLNSFTKNLESIDPSANYENTEFAGLDAYQRQLKRFNIKVSGSNSDVVEKFFQNSDSAVLFPEYIARAVKQGMEEADVLGSVVATVTQIDGIDYRTLSSTPIESSEFNENEEIPTTTVTNQKNLVKMHKRGTMLVSSYESLRFQHLDLFTVILKQIGASIVREQLADAVNVLLLGDGNDNPAGEVNLTEGSTFNYADLVNFWGSLNPYELNTMLASTSTMQKILNLTEMKDAQAGLTFHGTGKLVTPVGATLLHAPSLAENVIIGLDKNCALEMVQAGNIVLDYDKLIDKQLERASISAIAGFAKIFAGATKQLKLA